MLEPKWLHRGMALARLAASWSKDPSTKVGCAILRPDKSVASLGFNGFPPHEPDDRRLHNREAKYPLIRHAEHNALDFAGFFVADGTLCVTMPPCSDCCYRILDSGIAFVVVPKQAWISLPPRWQESASRAKEDLIHSGCNYILLEELPNADHPTLSRE